MIWDGLNSLILAAKIPAFCDRNVLHPAITQQSRPHDIGRAVFRYFSMSHSDLREPFYSGKGSTQTFSVDSNKGADSEKFKIFKVLKALFYT